MTDNNQIVDVSTEDSRGTEFDSFGGEGRNGNKNGNGNKIERMTAGALSGDVQIAFDAVKGFLQKDSLVSIDREEKKKL